MKIARPILDQLLNVGKAEKAVHLALLHYLRIINYNKYEDDIIEDVADCISNAARVRRCEPIDIAFNYRFVDYVPDFHYIFDEIKKNNEYDKNEAILTFLALKYLKNNK